MRAHAMPPKNAWWVQAGWAHPSAHPSAESSIIFNHIIRISRRDPYLSKWMMGRGPGCERAGWGRDPNHPEETRRPTLCVLSTPSVQAPSLLEFHPTPPRKSHPQLLFFESAAAATGQPKTVPAARPPAFSEIARHTAPVSAAPTTNSVKCRRMRQKSPPPRRPAVAPFRSSRQMRPLSAPSSGQLPALAASFDRPAPAGHRSFAPPNPRLRRPPMSDITPSFRRERPKTLATPKFLLGKRLGHHNPLLALATVDRRTAGRS